MPLRLIGKDETTELHLGGTSFILRKAPRGVVRRLTAQPKHGPQLDEAQLDARIWKHLLVGWRNLLNGDEPPTPVPFEPELVLDVVAALPGDVVAAMLARATGPEVVGERPTAPVAAPAQTDVPQPPAPHATAPAAAVSEGAPP